MSQPTWDNIKEKAGEAAQNTAQAAKSSLPWFSTFECKECGSDCRAGYAYDRQEGAFYQGLGGERPAWICENCGSKFRREETNDGILVLSRE